MVEQQGVWRSVTQADASRPVPRARRYHASVRHGGRVYVFGGQQGSQVFLNDVWVLDAEASTWEELHVAGPGYTPCAGHSASLVGSRVYLFGGVVGKVASSELWSIDLDAAELKWEKHPAPADGSTPWPSARHEHAAFVCGTDILVYGGSPKLSVYLRDMWLYSTATGHWIELQPAADSPRPAERAGALLYDAGEPDQYVVYGGFHGAGGFDYHKDSWLLRLDVASSTAHWTAVDTPTNAPWTARPLTCARLDDVVFVYGGFDGHQPSAELLMRKLSEPVWRRIELWMDSANANVGALMASSKGFKPLARYGHTMHAYRQSDDEGEEIVLLIVAGAGSTYLSDVVRVSIEVPRGGGQ